MSPEQELLKVLEARNLKKYFKQIYSNPAKKSLIFRKILAEEQLTTSEAIYIGDTPEDHLAAVEVGIPFIGRKSTKEFKQSGFTVCKNMDEVYLLLASSTLLG